MLVVQVRKEVSKERGNQFYLGQNMTHGMPLSNAVTPNQRLYFPPPPIQPEFPPPKKVYNSTLPNPAALD